MNENIKNEMLVVDDDYKWAVGERIKMARLNAGYTQQCLAEILDVTPQSVSLWETGKSLPETATLIELASLLNTSVSLLLNNKNNDENLILNKSLYDLNKTRSHLLTTANNFKMENTLNAIPFAENKHAGSCRKNSNIPYIMHPFSMACYLLSIGIHDDAIIAATILHDILEDTDTTVDELPVDDETKNLVSLLTCDNDKNDEKLRKKILSKYYGNIQKNPKAALIKLADRYNNLTTACWGLTHDHLTRMLYETEKYVLPLLDVLKHTIYHDARYALSFNLKTMLIVYKTYI